MTPIPVHAAASSEQELPSLVEQMELLQREIRNLAHSLSLQPDRAASTATDNWLAAEQSLCGAIEQERLETTSEFVLRLSLPQVRAGDIEIVALPQAILVHATRSGGGSGTAHGSDLPASGLILARRLDLTEAIDLSGCSASFEAGVLEIRAEKTSARTAAPPARARAAGVS